MNETEFLKEVIATKKSTTVFLTNGVKLQGCITGFDDFCIYIKRDGVTQQAYKHAISTIMQPQCMDEKDGNR